MKYLFILFILISCARAPLVNNELAMRKTKTPKLIEDSHSKDSFFLALKKHIDQMKQTRLVNDPMIFGKVKISKQKYLESLEKILGHETDYVDYIKKHFDFYEVYGKEDWSEVLITGYYEPFIKGSVAKTDKFQRPLYFSPQDLVSIDLKHFNEKYPGFKNLDVMQGRLLDKSIVPYWTRKDIDVDEKLAGKNLEICYVDPIDAFFLQIQGSGVVQFEDGSQMRVGYAGQNGQPYFSIGKAMTDKIPMEEMSMQRIRTELLKMNHEQLQDLLNKNKSYVFFKVLDGPALTYTGAEVSAGRTIATDTRFFPKGAMAFLDMEEPVFQSATELNATAWKRAPRFVLDQDTGGAIKGGYRVDLFVGSGETAEHTAGILKREGKLFYLVPQD